MVSGFELEALLIAAIIPVVAYAIGAIVHIVIDQVHGTRLVHRYFDVTKREIIEPLRAEVLGKIEEVKSSVPAAPKIPDFPPFPPVPTVEEIAAHVKAAVESTPVELPQSQLEDLKNEIKMMIQGVLNERAAHAKDALLAGANTVAKGGLAEWSRLLGVKRADLSNLGGYVQLLFSNPLGIQFVNSIAQPLGYQLIRVATDTEARELGGAIAPVMDYLGGR